MVDHSLRISLDRLGIFKLSLLSLGYYHRPAWTTSVLSVYLSVSTASVVFTTQRHCLTQRSTALHSAVLPTTAAASAPSYHISTNVGRRQPLPEGTSAGEHEKKDSYSHPRRKRQKNIGTYIRVDYLYKKLKNVSCCEYERLNG